MKNSKIKFLFLTVVSLSCSTWLSAQDYSDYNKKASNYYAYPVDNSNAPALTAAPKGYEPFHIEHYGRHGSRWHIGTRAYNRPVEILEIAERNDQLTPRGVELLAQLRQLQQAAEGRDGELSPLGHIQHRGIADRMTRNFPEVYADSGYVTARSSVVVRCILSMDNALQTLKAYNPNLSITSDASAGDMAYLAHNDTTNMEPGAWNRTKDKYTRLVKEYRKNHPDSYDFVDIIVKDRQFAQDSLELKSLLLYLFNVAANAQSLDHSAYPNFAPWDIFTPEEIDNFWKYKNAEWYLRMGNTQLTEGIRPYSQRALLSNIIESADTAVVSTRHGVNLRYGHEVYLLPLVVLLELDDYGQEINELEGIEEKWRAYEIFPMASNIQLVFYRAQDGNPDSPILVKALLNEREVRLPGVPYEGPYYRWDELRKYYSEKCERKLY